jgi:hypothetical protein
MINPGMAGNGNEFCGGRTPRMRMVFAGRGNGNGNLPLTVLISSRDFRCYTF